MLRLMDSRIVWIALQGGEPVATASLDGDMVRIRDDSGMREPRRLLPGGLLSSVLPTNRRMNGPFQSEATLMPLRPDFLPGPVGCGRPNPIPELPLRS